MELFMKIVDGFQQSTIFAKGSVLDVWLDAEYATGVNEFLVIEYFTRDWRRLD